jgi:hypothetical protein
MVMVELESDGKGHRGQWSNDCDESTWQPQKGLTCEDRRNLTLRTRPVNFHATDERLRREMRRTHDTRLTSARRTTFRNRTIDHTRDICSSQTYETSFVIEFTVIRVRTLVGSTRLNSASQDRRR